MKNSEDFGTNDWVIAEMYEQYTQDPESIDPRWLRYFKDRPVPTTVDESPAHQSTTIPTVEPRQSGVETPSQPGQTSNLGPEVPNPMNRPAPANHDPIRTPMRGAPMRTARNMDQSLTMPTATSVRSVPMKVVIENRATINNFLRRSRGGKVSFTHIIAYAMVQAIKAIPAMNHSYDETDGKPTLVENPDINLGIAIDLEKNGKRQLLVPNIKAAEDLNFAQFYAAYEDLVKRSRDGSITVDDFAHTTVTITNPGGLGTQMSVPRLMPGQAMILGVGSIDYPAQFSGTNQLDITQIAVSKVTTLTSTYDHRVIQGAQSGEFLRVMHQLLLGYDGFYDKIFRSLRIPYPPVAWEPDRAFHRNYHLGKQARVTNLIQSFRLYGHLQADVDPLEYKIRTHPDLELHTHGLTLWDLDREFPINQLGNTEEGFMTLREILDLLRDSYSHTMGIEYMHIHDPAQRRWIQEHVESPHTSLPHNEHLRILDQLSEAEVFETFLQTKYVGQTRFSLEGAESAIVILAQLCEQAADNDLSEVCIGMPHRGRLNVLTNIVGKAYSQIFQEFDNRTDRADVISGDVKYHLGAEGQYTAASGKTVLTSVAANPSHLEAVDPVLQGIARAKNDRLANPDDFAVMPVLMHGDASFAGQGVIYETLQMSQLRAYKTGGTIHLVVNNQIGFTTGPADGRTSVYATDVAKAVQAPILHVNGDDPDSCVQAARLAFEYRQRFGKDVVIDMLSYRRRGHNEGDDPSLTQPQMYDLIEKKRPVRKIYTEQLIGRGDISIEDAEQAVTRFRSRLEEVFTAERTASHTEDEYALAPKYPVKPRRSQVTSISREYIDRISSVYENFPAGFHVHPKVKTQLTKRVAALKSGPIDWASAELLAFGSLLLDGHQVRISGQDTRRGTFNQRFAAIVDRVTNEAWVPLKHLSDTQGNFDIFDSFLSEYAVMGFEYGYSVAAADALVCWEAQYGDFSNGAQIIIDEFVSSGFAKWTQKSGVVLLLPHGYEGAGPDHSSARIERFLQLCVGDNLAVCQPSTPASYFHLLRQHALVNWHRPLVIATPKSMLRNKMAVSNISDFTDNTWKSVLCDPTITDPGQVHTVLLCSGKVRWSLVNERRERGLEHKVAIIGLERLYPLPTHGLTAQLNKYRPDVRIRWVQDEPANQGAWPFLSSHLGTALEESLNRSVKIEHVTREALAAPSTGSRTAHMIEEKELLARAFS